MYGHGKENWVSDFTKRRRDVSTDTIENYLHKPLRSGARLPVQRVAGLHQAADEVPGHPLQTSIDVASLAPNAEITVFPWKEPEELRQRTIDRVRRFLKAHIPMRAAAQ